MYRQPHGTPPPPDPLVVVPGWGVGWTVVGRSTAEDVLASFGSDAKISRYDPSGEIFGIDYDYLDDDDYEPDRPAQKRRPSEIELEFGLVKAIKIGVYQTGLTTREGLRIGHVRRDVQERYGDPSTVLEEKAFVTLRYLHLGIQVDIDRDDGEVAGLTIFRPRW